MNEQAAQTGACDLGAGRLPTAGDLLADNRRRHGHAVPKTPTAGESRQ